MNDGIVASEGGSDQQKTVDNDVLFAGRRHVDGWRRFRWLQVGFSWQSPLSLPKNILARSILTQTSLCHSGKIDGNRLPRHFLCQHEFAVHLVKGVDTFFLLHAVAAAVVAAGVEIFLDDLADADVFDLDLVAES